MIDQIVEEALARYSSAEPLAGLEERVLQRVRAAGARPAFRLWHWALAACVPAAAGVALIAVLWLRTPPHGLGVTIATPPPPRIAAIPYAPRPTLPKIRKLPAPAPLTAQERALLTFATRWPDQAYDLQRRIDEPVRIEEIKITPIENNDLR